jgi:hemoglobin
MKMIRLLILLTLFLLPLLGCTQVSSNEQLVPEKSLFERIGGLPILNAIVKESLQELSTNPKTKRSFKNIKLGYLQNSIVNQLCYLTGGGCIYDGETMKKSHADAKITASEFEIFVDIHRKVFDKYISPREKNELLKILAPMRRDIVTSKSDDNIKAPAQ